MHSWMLPSTSSSDRPRHVSWFAGIEAAITFALIMLYIWWLRFRYPYAWIPILGLVIGSQARKREGFSKLGFQWNTGHDSARWWLVLALTGGSILAPALVFHSIRQVSGPGACLSFLLYCVWGLFQQYVLNAYFVNRFSDLLPDRPAAAPILASIFFSLAHLPNWFLMIVALAGGYFCARLYLRCRNLYFLGLAHGVVGFLIYLAVPDTISHHLYVGPKWFS
jgi:Type II CAAX prenyl endopeptidase Rce1-like